MDELPGKTPANKVRVIIAILTQSLAFLHLLQWNHGGTHHTSFWHNLAMMEL